MAWTHPIHHFQDRYEMISWDYRGLYQSAAPADPGALRIVDHARDGIAILDAVGAEKTILFGWSMGVQVALEMFRSHPDRVAGLVLMNGVPGLPWGTVLNLHVMGQVLPPLIRSVGSVPRFAEAVVSWAVSFPDTMSWIKRFGLAASTMDEDVWKTLAGSFETLDMGVYLRVLELLGEHDASDVLDDIDAPTLVIAGDRDVMTPRAAAERMARRIRGAELMIVPGGTHFVAVEYPELLNLRLEKFFRGRGLAPRAP
jgi:pimeloyl-ACP methyl ester carboxylesterase